MELTTLTVAFRNFVNALKVENVYTKEGGETGSPFPLDQFQKIFTVLYSTVVQRLYFLKNLGFLVAHINVIYVTPTRNLRLL
jgi:hypothetical protein